MNMIANSNPLKIAVIGVGLAGQSHLFDAVTSPNVKVVAVCSKHVVHANAVADYFGVPVAYTDIEQLLLRETPDACVVATPPSIIGTHTIQCLSYGAYVLAEKPLAIFNTDFVKINDLLSQSEDRLSIAYTRRYRHAWRTVRSWIENQLIGMILQIDCCWEGPYRNRYLPSTNTYRGDYNQRIGGVLLDSGCHALDAVQFLTGEIGKVISANVFIDKDADVDVEASVTLEQTSGARVYLDIVSSLGDEKRVVKITGSKGTIIIDEEKAIYLDKNGQKTECTDYYIQRPIADLLKMRNGEQIMGANFFEAKSVVGAIVQSYCLCNFPLKKTWRRPRAKPISRVQGAC